MSSYKPIFHCCFWWITMSLTLHKQLIRKNSIFLSRGHVNFKHKIVLKITKLFPLSVHWLTKNKLSWNFPSCHLKLSINWRISEWNQLDLLAHAVADINISAPKFTEYLCLFTIYLSIHINWWESMVYLKIASWLDQIG